MRPAGAVTGAPASAAPAPDRPSETAAADRPTDTAVLDRPSETAAPNRAGAPIAPPPIAPDGDYRIQLAAVRGEADARRAAQHW